MKIRIEKLEIEIPREFVSTISDGLLQLKQFDAQVRSRRDGQRESLVQAAVLTAINTITTSLNRPRQAVPTATPPEGDEKPSDDNNEDPA